MKGTIFESSAVPLRKWFYMIYLITSHPKGISSARLAEETETTQKTAWLMKQRITLSLKIHLGTTEQTRKITNEYFMPFDKAIKVIHLAPTWLIKKLIGAENGNAINVERKD